jgi:hypothetical protein
MAIVEWHRQFSRTMIILYSTFRQMAIHYSSKKYRELFHIAISFCDELFIITYIPLH